MLMVRDYFMAVKISIWAVLLTLDLKGQLGGKYITHSLAAEPRTRHHHSRWLKNPTQYWKKSSLSQMIYRYFSRP